jgi:nucleoside-diphosphate-sugar epimerase
MMRVLVTGATGVVGRALCEGLAASGYLVRASLRSEGSVPANISEKVIVGDVDENTDWGAALRGADAVIHLAARTHVLHDTEANSDLYFKTNTQGTRNLVRASAACGVRRFVFVSSVKVNGEQTRGHPFGSGDPPAPTDAYGKSKWMAEQAVFEAAAIWGMEVAIVRSPLVYGPGVRANFLRLMQCVDRKWLLPLGAVDNRRSLVSVWNLCDLLITALRSPAAPGKTLMVSDGEELSTPELIRRIARALDRPARLLPLPTFTLRLCASLIGRSDEIRRLCESLVVDIGRTRAELGWSPPMSVDEGLLRTVAWYRSTPR